MSPTGRPEGEYRSAQHEGTPMSRQNREYDRSAAATGWRRPAAGSARMVVTLLALLAAALAAATPPVSAPDAPLFDGMRPYHPSAGPSSALAQRYFEQGMTFAWGFNPAEAARSFAAATRADPRCAAC
jgi:hypothetical protein